LAVRRFAKCRAG